MAKSNLFRDRIVGFERVKASDLVADPNNWRQHGDEQRAVLTDLLKRVGIADALITRRLADGKLKVIDGHLRKDLDRRQTWPVLILDVTEQEAAQLMLSIDPIASLASAEIAKLDILREMAGTDSKLLLDLWEAARTNAQDLIDSQEQTPNGDPKKLADKFLVPPFSVLSARDGWWQERKRAWIALGIQSELGRGDSTPPGGSLMPAMSKKHPGRIVRSDSKARPIEGTGRRSTK